MGLRGDAHKFINLFGLCWNEITLGYIENINSLLDEVDTEQSSSETNPFLSSTQKTQLRLNNFFLHIKDDQSQVVTELLKIVKTVIDKSVSLRYIKSNLLNDYNDCLAIIERKNILNAEQGFLKQSLDSVSFENLPIEESVKTALYQYYEELSVCIKYNAPLSAIILCGGMLESLLLGIAIKNDNRFMGNPQAPPKRQK